MSARVLYLSYDGMTDPLGQSQVMPYLLGLSSNGYQITLLSCEKVERFKTHETEVRDILRRGGIDWQPLFYHKKPPILSTLWDLFRIQRLAARLHAQKKFDLVHCRGYLSALIGVGLKKRFGLKFLFDMRGFWPDERVDGKLWSQKKWLYRVIYRYFKRKEIEFLNASDCTICLTHAGRSEMQRWKINETAKEKIEVIPCCADLEHFDQTRVSEKERSVWRKKLDLREEDFVITYLGSLGTWYLLDEMLDFFKVLLRSRKDAKLFFITGDSAESVYEKTKAAGILPASIRIQEGRRDQVPTLLSLSDVGLFFIRPSYSKTASSPTKMAEYLGMGIPIIANADVGDTNWLMSKFKVGLVVEKLVEEDFKRAVLQLDDLKRLDAASIRSAAREYFSLEKGVDHYNSIYKKLAGAWSGHKSI